jgi:hypothetical protein
MAFMHARWFVLSLASFVLFAVAMILAQEIPVEKDSDKAVIDHWLDVSKKYATEYEIFPADDAKATFELVPEPVFRHTQSVRGDDIGAVYVWVDKQGRPAVVGVTFAYSLNDSVRRSHVELHSLYPAPITAKFRDRDLWESRTPGLKWHPFPGETPTPADTAARRLLQLRQLARRFEGHTTDFQQKRWELRQVATPIFTYDVGSSETLGGAMFAFCQGTDTEIVLLIEARAMADGQEFYFAYAPFTDYDIVLTVDDQNVEEAPKGTYRENGNPHFWDPIENVPKPEFERAR